MGRKGKGVSFSLNQRWVQLKQGGGTFALSHTQGHFSASYFFSLPQKKLMTSQQIIFGVQNASQFLTTSLYALVQVSISTDALGWNKSHSSKLEKCLLFSLPLIMQTLKSPAFLVYYFMNEGPSNPSSWAGLGHILLAPPSWSQIHSQCIIWRGKLHCPSFSCLN